MDELYADAWEGGLERFRSPYVFRGVGDASSDLSTTLVRLGGGRPDLGRLEGHLLRNFRKYAHANAAAGDSIWNWLALAAHHGLPTRLLDWSYSPTVAAHFATENLTLYGADACIWCLNHRALCSRLPASLQTVLEADGSHVFSVEQLSGAADSLEKLQHLSNEEFVLFLEPPSLDSRIVNQFALFSLMSRADSSLHDWLGSHTDLARRIIIPAGMKWEIRDKLDQAGITERMLFPGLDGLTAWLTRYYSQRTGKTVEEVNQDRSSSGDLNRS